MALYGTIVDGILIIIGSLLGMLFSKIPERYKETVMHGIALTVILIGFQMAMKTDAIIVVLISLLFGAVLGELFRIEDMLNRFGGWMASKFPSKNSEFTLAQGFVTATLMFVVGALAIIGALDSGLRGNHEILITKGVIDGFSALVLTTTLGIGVLFSVIPVVLYQGTIALFATQIERWLSEDVLNGLILELTSVGGILIVAIGLNLLNVVKIRIGNLLPSIIIVGGVYYIYNLF
ncbi:DUF554 domain-containing protein [Virgibacillus sp. MSJ-26]|uniref:DUF554 domain-containing protein n=1 Tax=Virgibacillus sp. MSJ-26 TaxID=2841522 RepID=UPI001C11CED7|nr:DUF554 domain-containing protein [Virgibacillus sp. MSJ-26]MBU5467475.1 DUF554 domain-containing protein [Virgibacillus sp. MSJ-26]